MCDCGGLGRVCLIRVATCAKQPQLIARNVVNTLKVEFGADIKVDLLVKPYDGAERLYRAGIDKIDNHVEEKYDRAELERLLRSVQE
jgi:hypothetical protein